MQSAFHLFGMELLANLNLAEINAFFCTFFALPKDFWQGFLASNLSSVKLLGFAMYTFVLAPVSIKSRLVSHLVTHPSGKYLVRHYVQALQGTGVEEGSSSSNGSSSSSQ